MSEKEFEGDCGLASLVVARYVSKWVTTNGAVRFKMNLANVGLTTLALALTMPYFVTYVILYPLFRLVFGTLYPAYASYKAVRTRNVKEYVKWMMYWIVFALFTCAETFTDVFFSFWFPFYYEIKIILVIWLLSPATKGSSILYRRFVHPALTRREAEIDDALARATEQGYTAVLHLGTKGVNYATTVLMQTAIKGGGGLVQQLKKSYSLSDLTGEKEDENRNTANSHDEVDSEGCDTRRRDIPGRRGYSPRRTQSGGNHVEMYFSEVDVDVRHRGVSKSRESTSKLNNIKSSDDISSGYSSGEALHVHRSAVQGEGLVRTSSVGARVRAKPRSTTKKTPEDVDEDNDATSIDDIEIPQSACDFLTSERLLDLLLLLSKREYKHTSNVSSANSDLENIRNEDEEASSADSGDFVDSVSDVQTERLECTIKEPSEVPRPLTPDSLIPNEENVNEIDVGIVTGVIHQEKVEDLKLLLTNARKAVSDIMLNQNISNNKSNNEENSSLLEIEPAISRSNSDGLIRAGKYNKKPAPKVPLKCDDESCENALKATLVIKTGRVKTFTNPDISKDVFLDSERKKKSHKAKEGFSKLLTIPKDLIRHAFNKGQPLKEENLSVSRLQFNDNDSSSTMSEVDIEKTLLQAALDDKDTKSDSYIDLHSDLDLFEDKNPVCEENQSDKSGNITKLQYRQLSHSPTRTFAKSTFIE